MPQPDILCQQVKSPMPGLNHDQRGPMEAPPPQTSQVIAKAIDCSPQPDSKALLLKTTLMSSNTEKPGWCPTISVTLLPRALGARRYHTPQQRSNYHSHPTTSP